ncbi:MULTISPECIES: hydroxyacylglutathione hydrolase [unclassified Gilliamella]|uniref:hydroxyacylglutathione hydrolase n=1 Tax=unclassified Gilliamella TaxID=2685620 RepID=UPI00080E0277|nr:hydroxyacylglutathione hydrolase [Gilliamella apicola]OCG21292.1 hydroxyacylglutathione hydrolase [Gilliamella apicola]OCG22264.1 hydroxyacylglutathione hydrolase [Gilliamella apicola]
MYQINSIASLKDNYIWIITNTDNQAVIIDPGETEPVINYLNKHKLSPIGILLTHHHIDHTGGVKELKTRYPDIEVYGSREIDLPINHLINQTNICVGNFNFDVITVPGHTLGHLAYYCCPYLFSGDTLFSAGCGRVFEGTYQQMLDSLNKLKNLPNETLICAGHEYTLSNLEFAQNMIPEDEYINKYLKFIAKKSMSLPSTLLNEKQINIFLRCDEKKLQNKFNFNSELELFAFFRSQKDIF